MTNAEKFKEVFGKGPDIDVGVMSIAVDCYECNRTKLRRCKGMKWWYEEYKGNLSELRQQDGEDKTV